MRERSLTAGLALTELGFGAAQLGNLNRETTTAHSVAAIDAAWVRGIRYFDTAPHYGLGLSERRLGEALAGRPRGEFIVSTKVGRALVPTPERAGKQDEHGFVVPATHRREWDFSRGGILRSLESSLDRLGLDRVDIVYLHDPDDHWDEASTTGIDTLVELREQGVVGAIGAGMNQTAMLTEFIRRCDVDVVMLAGRYTLLDQSALDKLIPLALERGVRVVAAGVYNSGLLSRPEVPESAHFDYLPASAELIARARAIARICEAHGVTLPDAAVQFALRQTAVVSVVLGTRTAEQVIEGVERYETPIPDALWTALVAAGHLRPEAVGASW
ncbi:aldo/keto reductase [Microbacterium sp. RURRCA19A]|uniref:aldo/keto reductase n=1 Tax=Microbacterium sp. RURRCA19A TaxID=1907391 RepID=UPI0009543FE2|nr:aldo/keto reductase [Microbacterium sp. RURRCA19A]SIS19931.1 D-threo-aldose 1-dehydrogenase [Microbacterium sp. RURRCA19A]